MKKNLILTLVSLIFVGVLFALFSNAVLYWKEDHWNFLNTVRSIKQHNSDLNVSLLKTSLSVYKNYDLIVSQTNHLKSSFVTLEELAKKEPPLIQVKVKELGDKLKIKLDRVETFKSTYAVYKNSTTYFRTLIKELVEDKSAITNKNLRNEMTTLALHASLFLSSSQSTSPEKLNENLERISRFPGLSLQLREKIIAIGLHRNIIIKTRGSINLAASYVYHLNSAASEIETIFQKNVRVKTDTSFVSQTIIFSFSIILFLYTIYILIKLWKTMRNLEIANSHLEERVLARTSELEETNKIVQSQQKTLVFSSKMSALGEMAGGIAHEINNPLAIIALSCKSLRICLKRNLDPALILEHITTVEDTASRIGKIVKGLRTFSRNSLDDELVDTNFKSIISDTLALCHEKFRNHEVELIIDTSNDPGTITTNPISLAQVLLNLLNNAFDAIDGQEKKWLRLELRHDHEFLEVLVTDCGHGISPEVAQKIMQPFFTTKDIGKGTGLGLSISKGIMESLGGSLTYDPTCANTRFVMSLPLKKKSLAAS